MSLLHSHLFRRISSASICKMIEMLYCWPGRICTADLLSGRNAIRLSSSSNMQCKTAGRPVIAERRTGSLPSFKYKSASQICIGIYRKSWNTSLFWSITCQYFARQCYEQSIVLWELWKEGTWLPNLAGLRHRSSSGCESRNQHHRWCECPCWTDQPHADLSI